MKTARILTILFLALGLMVCLAETAGAAEPMGTAFTYQGHLYDNNDIANGLYDFQFKLYDANNGSNQLGNDVNVPDVDVIDGYFTVELDFGSSVFEGNAVWLEIGVRPGEQNDPNTYKTLSPRQQITPTPEAIHAQDGVPQGYMILGQLSQEVPQGYSYTGTTVTTAGTSTWQGCADMPTSREGAAAAVVKGKIYVTGGTAGMSNPFLKMNEEYDPATNTWATKAQMIFARRFHVSVAVNDKVYVIGGQDDSYNRRGTVYEYDPQTDGWTTKTTMPTSRMYAAATVLDGNIYVIGGQGSSGTPVAAVEAYDPETNSWEVKADLPAAIQQLGAAAVGAKIYVMGGYLSRTDNYEYDPQTDTWNTKASMPTGRHSLVTVGIINRIFAIGGNSAVSEVYDPYSDSWSITTSITSSTDMPAWGLTDGKIYVMTGGPSKITLVLDPSVELPIFMKD